MRRVGLFGGSFDPVHYGHLLVARAAFEAFHFNRLFFIPAAQSPFKPDNHPADVAIRLRLLRLALAGESRCELDLQEIERGGPSFTIDTVRDYSGRFPEAELFYLIGADHLRQLPKWRDAAELARRLKFVVVNRPGEHLEAAPPDFRIHSLPGIPFGVSSSQIRERIRAGLTLSGLVPPTVAEAITRDRLYQ